MQKQTVIAVPVILTLLGVGWFVMEKQKSTTNSLDYFKLEKDTLYGAEEGKYANLPELGKRLLREAYVIPACVAVPTQADCADSFQEVANGASVVAAKDGYALLSIISTKGEQAMIYDVKQGRELERLYIPGKVMNEKILLFPTRDANKILMYYKPGMIAFKWIPNSSLVKAEETYFTDDGMWPRTEAKITDDKLTISVFIFEQGKVETKKVREAIFDLATL